MPTLRALVIDDEARARRALSAMLTDFCDGVEVVGAAGSVDEALAFLKREPADVLFLDVSMPEQDGFALAERPELAGQPIVFVTAHADFAPQAFRVQALDYLLKPVNVGELREAVERVRRARDGASAADRASLRLFVDGKHLLVPLSTILYLEADGSYTNVVTADARHFVSKGLRELAERLEGKGFYRSHRSYLLNLQYVRSVGAAAKGTVTMTDGTEAPVSRYRRSELMALLG